MFQMPSTQWAEKGITPVNTLIRTGPEAALKDQRQNPKSYLRTLYVRSELSLAHPQLAGRFFKTKSSALFLKLHRRAPH